MTQTAALLLTLAIEVPLAVGITAACRWAPGRLLAVALASVGASLVTHPILWLVDPLLAPSIATAPRWALLEGAVAVVEAAVYAGPAGLGVRRGAVVALVANAASFAAGLLVYST